MAYSRYLAATFLSLCWLQATAAQTRFTLRENLQPGSCARISSRVDLSGTMTVPIKDEKDTRLEVFGSSAVDYHERILAVEKGDVAKTIRQYERLKFERTVGDQEQQNSLRPEIRKLVVLRRSQAEVPFSPDGPLTWGEIDLVRTDVFAPALAGLLPDYAVQIGDRWQAKTSTVQELTDLERIEQGSLVCTLESASMLGGRRLARIAINGTVRGVGEDGPARHQLDGFCFFDLDANRLSYLSLRGVHIMAAADGKELGRIEGTFVMTREAADAGVLNDQALRGLTLEPTDENTQLLFEHPDIGVRLLHSRRWRIAGVNGNQITLDETQGSGILITLEALDKMPTAKQYLQEAQTDLTAQKATIRSIAPAQQVPGAAALENFGISAEIAKQAVYLEYYVVRQPLGGAMIVARLTGSARQAMQSEVSRIARSLQIKKQQ